ncbi:MAG: VOC family protein [Vulcanimicrobiaceae bacterium]
MQLTPNLFFNGNAEEVLEHYRSALGGEVEIIRFEGSPAAENAPAGWERKVLYGTVRSPLGVVAAMDAPPSHATKTPGDNFSLSVQTESEAQADAVFAKLLAGGTQMMPLEKTFWAAKFGMLMDKFGIRWMVQYG